MSLWKVSVSARWIFYTVTFLWRPAASVSWRNKTSLRKLADRGLFRSAMCKLIVQRGEFLLPILSAVLKTLAGLIFRSRHWCYRKCIWSRRNNFRNAQAWKTNVGIRNRRRNMIMISGLRWLERFGKRASHVRRRLKTLKSFCNRYFPTALSNSSSKVLIAWSYSPCEAPCSITFSLNLRWNSVRDHAEKIKFEI